MTLNPTIAPPADTWLWWQLVIAPLFVALCTFLAGLAWAAAVATSHWSRSFINQVIVEIDLTWLKTGIAEAAPNVIVADAGLYCLVVRFGTDHYLANIASQQERYQGRLINRVIEIDGSGRNVILRLPVHRKLGTQFKLYYLFPDKQKAAELWWALKQAKGVPAWKGEHAVHQILLDRGKPAGRKCWFRLAGYGAQQTVDKFVTSYFSASQMRGFERRNGLKLWRWIRRKDQSE